MLENYRNEEIKTRELRKQSRRWRRRCTWGDESLTFSAEPHDGEKKLESIKHTIPRDRWKDRKRWCCISFWMVVELRNCEGFMVWNKSLQNDTNSNCLLLFFLFRLDCCVSLKNFHFVCSLLAFFITSVSACCVLPGFLDFRHGGFSLRSVPFFYFLFDLNSVILSVAPLPCVTYNRRNNLCAILFHHRLVIALKLVFICFMSSRFCAPFLV